MFDLISKLSVIGEQKGDERTRTIIQLGAPKLIDLLRSQDIEIDEERLTRVISKVQQVDPTITKDTIAELASDPQFIDDVTGCLKHEVKEEHPVRIFVECPSCGVRFSVREQ